MWERVCFSECFTFLHSTSFHSTSFFILFFIFFLKIFYCYFPNRIFSYCTACWPSDTYMCTFFFPTWSFMQGCEYIHRVLITCPTFLTWHLSVLDVPGLWPTMDTRSRINSLRRHSPCCFPRSLWEGNTTCPANTPQDAWLNNPVDHVPDFQPLFARQGVVRQAILLWFQWVKLVGAEIINASSNHKRNQHILVHSGLFCHKTILNELARPAIKMDTYNAHKIGTIKKC